MLTHSLLLIVVLASAASADQVTVTTIDGSSFVGALGQLSSDQITLQTPDGERVVAADQILTLATDSAQTPAAQQPTAWITLVDGSRLTTGNFTAKAGVAQLAASDRRLEIPTAAIRQVRFSPPDSSAAWPADVDAHASGDLLAVRKKEAIDFLTGVVGEVTETTVEFRIDGETIPVKRSKIDGMVYYHKTADEQPQAHCVVESAGGWRISAKDLALAENEIVVTSAAGPTVRLPRAELARIDFSAGKVTYLSDLEPESIDWTPMVSLGAIESESEFYGLRRDTGRKNQPLQIAGRTYAKGLALASRTELIYRLPSGARKLKALAGMDDSIGPGTSVRLQISADEKTLVDALIAAGDPPTELDLDLTGARRLSILVDYGDGLDAGDYLNLVDARIVK